MPKVSQEQLLKRLSSLVKKNQDLENKLKELSEKYETLLELNTSNEVLIEKLSKKKSESSSSESKDKHLKFDMATILFARIYGFDKVAQSKNSQVLMDELDEILFEFDKVLDKHNIEKIKTIGDTYMACGGIPIKNITNPVQVVLAAIEMREVMSHINLRHDGTLWDVTFGIHTGPVTATTSGKKKVNYDIKGDTVNIVTRMESAGEARKVIISVMTYELIREFFECEFFGEIPVKYKGDLEMYEVKQLKGEFLEKGQITEPNDKFRTKFLLMQFTDIQEVILNRLEKELPDYLFYHNVKHTVDVVTQAELIGLGEGVSDEEILLLKTAGLFHDAGHILGYDNHEYNSTIIARDYLPKFGYSDKQIDTICDIIMATELPPKPKNLLQRIICDSDLDYLGRSDFIPVSNTLYEELKHQNKIGSLNDWNKLQIKFLSGHQFFTDTAKSLREVNKQKQIERIKQLIEE